MRKRVLRTTDGRTDDGRRTTDARAMALALLTQSSRAKKWSGDMVDMYLSLKFRVIHVTVSEEMMFMDGRQTDGRRTIRVRVMIVAMLCMQPGCVVAGKPVSSSRLTRVFTPFDLTWYDYTASESRVIMSGQVRRGKKGSKTAWGARFSS